MVIRSKVGIHKQKVLLLTKESSTCREALQYEEWKAVMQAEYLALLRNETWLLVDLPRDRRPIGCRWVFRMWVFKVKENLNGSVHNYKARFVAKDFHQEPGHDFFDTFSPVIKATLIRVALTIALTNGWTVRQLDIDNACFSQWRSS